MLEANILQIIFLQEGHWVNVFPKDFKMNSFPECFFRAVFACHAEKEPAETFCHLQKSPSMATVL